MPWGHPGTTPGHPSPTSATPDHDRETMPPHPPRPPQRRSTGPFDNAELRALYGIHATTPSSKLVAALQEHLQDVNPSRLFAVVPLQHAATTEIFARSLFLFVTGGTPGGTKGRLSTTECTYLPSYLPTYLCAAAPGAHHPRDTDRGRPC